MDQPTPALEPQPEVAQTPAMSLGARLMNVFATPGDAFADVRTGPPSAANWLAPALILILVSWIGGWLMLSQDAIKQQLNTVTDRAIEKRIEKEKMSPEKAEATR